MAVPAMKRGCFLSDLNPAQRDAATRGVGSGARPHAPLLVIAGAGSGKTMALAYRVANLIVHGADPRRILLLTFTRRAAREMTRRAQSIVARARVDRPVGLLWSGTFHGVANRLLRLHAAAVGLDPSFTVLDRSDAEDLMNLVRGERRLGQGEKRFPQKATCLAIYSHTVNAQRPLEDTLECAFPWCASWGDELKGLFRQYVERKQTQHVFDYDDLLLYWYHLMTSGAPADALRGRFDFVLVDEYQDTNALQASILLGLRPDGRGVTVVGDDAQAIYAFRAATVRNILDFPAQFDPPAETVTLEQNYRSTGPILRACNAVIALARERFTKDLFSDRPSRERPFLVTVEDESVQVTYVVDRILEQREAGIPLQRQAVLFRASHHSDLLEVELGRRNIPFVKYGGLKFLEVAHVKDMLSVLRWAENPRDAVAAFRVLQLLPGIGPVHAERVIGALEEARFDIARLSEVVVPPAAGEHWPGLCVLLVSLRRSEWAGQVEAVRNWYEPHLERLYDAVHVRRGDLVQFEQISTTYESRERFLTALALDPPEVMGDEAGPPSLDEDFLVLSTIHSAKGQEWDAVFVLNAADGCIPSDLATGTPEEIEEERRLLYVAMTRARDHLHIIHPHRFFTRPLRRDTDRHVYTPRTRFIPDTLLPLFHRRAVGHSRESAVVGPPDDSAPVDVGARLRAMWE